MLEKNLERLIFFGTALRYLQDATSRYLLKKGSPGWGTVENLRSFLEHLDELGLTVTKRAAYKLEKFKSELEGDTDELLSMEKAAELQKIMHELRPTLVAESSGMIAYIISERRFRIDHLMSNTESLFAKSVFNKLPSIARGDFSESSKCLAFERPTAAAFHMLRATEAVLRHYYCEKIKRKRSPLMWGAMIVSMRTMPKRFPKVIINQLDHIRDGFRNPTSHPEMVYDIEGAEDLLSICIDASNRMIQDLDKK